jgi:hypothetical protein
MRISLPIAVAIASASVAVAPSGHAQSARLDLRLLAPVDALYVASLVPGSGASRPELFGVTLSNDTPEPVHVVLAMSLARERPAPMQLYRGVTRPFLLAPGVRPLTSRDLTIPGRDVSIVGYSLSHAGGAVPASGRFASGSYVLTVTLESPAGELLDRRDLRLELQSSSRVELLSPGTPLDAQPALVVGTTPRFLWSADGEASDTEYHLRVVPVAESSPSAAVGGGHMAWETTTRGTSIVYPGSVDALRLNPGGTYAWQVTRASRTSAGVERIESPIFWFRIMPGPAGASGPAPTTEAFLRELLRALGFADELAGFRVSEAMLHGGRILSPATLAELLAAVVTGEIPVLSSRIR